MTELCIRDVMLIILLACTEEKGTETEVCKHKDWGRANFNINGGLSLEISPLFYA